MTMTMRNPPPSGSNNLNLFANTLSTGKTIGIICMFLLLWSEKIVTIYLLTGKINV